MTSRRGFKVDDLEDYLEVEPFESAPAHYLERLALEVQRKGRNNG